MVQSRSSPATGANEEKDDFSGIRSYLPKDRSDANMLLGLSSMEGLATANKQVYLHPLVLMFWAAISLTLDYFSGWWPEPELWWSPLALAVGFGATSIPILVIVELINRSYFEALMRKTIGKEDLVDIQTFYTESSRSPSSCVVLSHHGDAIACCAIDAQHAGEELDVVIEEVKSRDRPFDLSMVSEWINRARAGKAKATSEENKLASEKESVIKAQKEVQRAALGRDGLRSRGTGAGANGRSMSKEATTDGRTAELRHLHVDVPYRRKGVGRDLLDAALARTFGPASKVESVIVEQKFWTTSAGVAFLRKSGFKLVNREEARKLGWRSLPSSRIMGVRYNGRWWKLSKEEWARTQ